MPMLGIMASAISGNLWEPAGAYDSISTQVLSSNTAAITFSSIPSTYTHLQIRCMARSNRTSTLDDSMVTFNGDTATNYSYHYLAGDGGGGTASAGGSASQANMNLTSFAAASLTTQIHGVAIIDILDYANTNKYKTARALGGEDANGSGYLTYNSGNWRSTSAITSITLTPRFGTAYVQYSSFALYGIK